MSKDSYEEAQGLEECGGRCREGRGETARLWLSCQLVAQGAQARHRKRWSPEPPTVPAPHPQKSPTTRPRIQDEQNLCSCPCHQHHGDMTVLRGPACGHPDGRDPTAPQAAPAQPRSTGGESGPSCLLGTPGKVASSLQGPDRGPQAAPPSVHTVTPQHAHSTDRHRTEPHTCY